MREFKGGRGLLPQKIDRQPSSHESEPTGKAATPLTPELTQFPEVVLNNAEKEFLKEILYEFLASFDMIETESFPDRMIDER